jgi:gas vesicle protein
MADDRGSSAAVLLALLLAPQSGHGFRERLRGYARRAEDGLRDLAGRAGEAFEEVVDDGKEFVETKKSVLREAFDAGREAMRRERDRMRGEEPGGG